MPTPSTSSSRRGRRSHRRRTGPALVVATMVLGALALLAVVQLTAARRELTGARAELAGVRRAALVRDDEEARERLDRVEERVRAARRAARRFPLGLLRPLPVVGSPSRAAGAAARAAGEATAAARIVVDAGGGLPTAGKAPLDGRDLSSFHQAATTSSAALARARPRLDAAARAVEGARGALLPWVSGPARAVASEIDQARRQLAGGERALSLLADLTAPGADVRLLVLGQDSLELRPTGGYIGSYGVLHFSRGTVRLERYEATESLPKAAPPMEPPKDLAPSLPGPWGLSNANWWPDFPTSAQTATELFARQGGGRVDGVLAITEHVTARLVGLVGPLQVPGYATPVVEEGFDERVVYEVERKRPLDTPRKKFLVELADVLFERVFALPAERLPALAAVLDRSAGAGDVQLWFADGRRQGLVADTVVSGRLPKANGDFLMLVDANMTASKANLGLVKDVTYRVTRPREGLLRARLEMTVRNGEPEDAGLNPYYNGYLRVYVPQGARLLGDREGQGDTGRAKDGPYRVFAQLLDVAPLAEQRVQFDYELPADVAPHGKYRLTWLRQVGTDRDSLSAVVAGRSTVVEGRKLKVERSLRGHPVAEWWRDRWIVRRLGL